jgi:hypothetical protein
MTYVPGKIGPAGPPIRESVNRARKFGTEHLSYFLSAVVQPTIGNARSVQTKGKAMIKNTLLCAAAIGASAVLTSSAVAQANPATPIPVIESSAAQLCGAINGNPAEDGVIDGLNSLQNRGLDETDGALVLITAIHHVCPQHEVLMMGTMVPIAAEEVCSKPM